jgi:cytidyltransferase-like protein
MVRVFVSGCYDILHAGHLQFFEEARALGDHLTVSFANEAILWKHKERRPSLPDDHKQALLSALKMVDEVVSGDGEVKGLDFEPIFREMKPDILAVTEDDRYGELKEKLCAEVGARYVRLPKTPPKFEPISTTEIRERICGMEEAPLRVDFGGGWLDVPRHAREGAYIVNCAISPRVSLHDWPYEKKAGLGGSGAWALLNGRDSVQAELDLGVGWQDPAVIRETGLCVWKSGKWPRLELKRDGGFLKGLMALQWTGAQHDTPGSADLARDYNLIERAGAMAREAVMTESMAKMVEAVLMSYVAQLEEGMEELPEIPGSVAHKYCGGGHGGYALYLFLSKEARDEAEDVIPIEPWCAC